LQPATGDEKTRWRLAALMLFCTVFAAAVLLRAAQIQLLRNPRLEAMARRQFNARMLVRPRRGTIEDREGHTLAVNREAHSLAANPSKIRNKRAFARAISRATNVPYARVLQRLGEKREFIWIKRHLSESELARLKKGRLMGAEGELVDGVWLVKESERAYPQGELAAHVLGTVNVDSEGLEGTELWLNERLRGNIVSVSAIKDAMGRPTFIDAEAAKDVQDGETVRLTIDSALQFSVEQELRASVQRTGARGGTAIVMNSTTGEILAMANQPSFLPGQKGVPPERRRNRAVTDGFEPGSTLKPVLLASALSHGWKLSDQIWGEQGQFKVQGKRISEAEAHEKFEWISLKKIIQVSSNVGAAKVALKLGADSYYQTLRDLGFGSRTNVGFPGEISGKLPPHSPASRWQPLTLANVGFGQGVLVTPLQVLRAYAAFANGGWLVQPTLIRAEKKADPENTTGPKRLFSAAVVEHITEALESVTRDGGTGTQGALVGYRVAGKTGTAQMVDPQTGAYSKSQYVASFAGYPIGVDPKVVIFVSVHEPRGTYYASEVAAPLFREVLTAAVRRYAIPPHLDANRILAEKRPEPVTDRIPISQAAVQLAAELEPAGDQPGTGVQVSWKMPPLGGLSAREALRFLQGRKFKVEMRGYGIVSRQYPEEGRVIAEGDTIRLVLEEP
jgi:cell division protein FtsI (penicillin-binding protein 3)